MISLNKKFDDTKDVVQVLKTLDKSSFENSREELVRLAKSDFHLVSDWIKKELPNDEYKKWWKPENSEEAYKTYCENQQLLKDKQDLAVWREGLNPLQKTARFLLGDDKRLPRWLGGETNPVQARKDDDKLTAELRRLQGGSRSITALLD